MLRSNGPITLSFPAFRGATRKIVLLAMACTVIFLLGGLVMPQVFAQLRGLLALQPLLVGHGWLWLPFTYSFAPDGLLNEAFALFSLWLFAAMLEDEFGSRWLIEFFVVATAGGGFLACAVSYGFAGRYAALALFHNAAFGMWPAVMALLIAFARFHGEEKIQLYFLIGVKAKYLAAGFLLIYVVGAVWGGDKFGAMEVLCVALIAYAYLRLVPRKGLQFSVSERWFGWRNAYYRSKRRRAGKQFEVYMKKQGKDVHVDKSEPRDPKNPNDKRWMN